MAKEIKSFYENTPEAKEKRAERARKKLLMDRQERQKNIFYCPLVDDSNYQNSWEGLADREGKHKKELSFIESILIDKYEAKKAKVRRKILLHQIYIYTLGFFFKTKREKARKSINSLTPLLNGEMDKEQLKKDVIKNWLKVLKEKTAERIADNLISDIYLSIKLYSNGTRLESRHRQIIFEGFKHSARVRKACLDILENYNLDNEFWLHILEQNTSIPHDIWKKLIDNHPQIVANGLYATICYKINEYEKRNPEVSQIWNIPEFNIREFYK